MYYRSVGKDFMTAIITAITENVQLKLTNIHESIIIHNTAVKFILIKIENL